ncbi:phosphatidylserine/phosphatidylglycerophosphate/cardiolipin synthase family protein, partial [Mesorhizobium sp. M7A.F.Ca.CA.004.04.2.1]
MKGRASIAIVLFGLAVIAGCAGAGRNACDLLQGQSACARPALSAETAGPRIATAQFFGDAGTNDYEKRFLALLAHHQLGAMDRANGTGPFGHDRHEIRNSDF